MGQIFSYMWKNMVSEKEVRIVMIGLDAAGKTTILYKLKLGEVVTTIPTIGFNVETIRYKNISFTVWDLGFQERLRPLWHYYYQNTKALIFVVDSTDTNRFDEARNEIHRLCNEEELKNATILVFANKQDMPQARPAAEISNILELNNIVCRPWYIQECSAKTGAGLYEGLDWLSTKI